MDASDVWAATIVGELLEREWLVLVSAKSRPAIADALAALLADDVTSGAELSEALIDHPGVADLLCDDDALEELVRETRPEEEEEEGEGAEGQRGRGAEGEAKGAELLMHPRSETEERVLEVFGAEAPKQSVTVVEKPRIGKEVRYVPAPPLYFVIDLETKRAVTRRELFEVFTQAWFEKAGFPKLCGREVASGEVLFVGTPASDSLLASRGIERNPSYEACFFALPALEEGAPREAEDFERALAAVKDAARVWTPSARVAPEAAAAEAAKVAAVAEDLGGELRLVLAAPKEGFLGRSVWNLLHSMGLRWGDMDLFNWETDEGWSDPALFWVGTTTDPGYFLPEEIALDKRYADLTFAMGVGSKPEPEAIATAMIAFATAIKDKLGGTLRTSRGEALDPAAFVRAAARLHADLTARGFPAGAPHTVELLVALSI